MKKILFIGALATLLSLGVKAQTGTQAKQDSTTRKMLKMAPSKYCVALKDGKSVVMAEDKVVTWDVVLSDGSKLAPNGAVTNKDGNKMVLQPGQCIEKSGTLMGGQNNKGGM